MATNQLAPETGGGFSSAYRNNANYGPDAEVFITMATRLENYSIAGLRLIFPGSDGYNVRHVHSALFLDTWEIFRVDDDIDTLLGATLEQDADNGDGLGLEAISSTLTAYRRSAGVWSSLFNRTDATYTGAGRVGFRGNEITPRWDDFGGGTVVTAAAAIAPGHGLLLAGMRNRMIQHV